MFCRAVMGGTGGVGHTQCVGGEVQGRRSRGSHRCNERHGRWSLDVFTRGHPLFLTPLGGGKGKKREYRYNVYVFRVCPCVRQASAVQASRLRLRLLRLVLSFCVPDAYGACGHEFDARALHASPRAGAHGTEPEIGGVTVRGGREG